MFRLRGVQHNASITPFFTRRLVELTLLRLRHQPRCLYPMYTSKSESKTPTKLPESLASSQNNSHMLFVEDFEYSSCFSP